MRRLYLSSRVRHSVLLLMMLLVSMPMWAQRQIRVTGTVTDEKKEPLIGVSVRVVGTTNGASTDIDGRFAISGVAEGAMLEVTFVGMQTLRTPALSTPMTIVLREDSQSLDELVVVGYGTQKKVNLTGAVASVDAKKLATRPTTSVMGALQGTVPGVTIISRPGGGISLNIRGRGNLGTSNPLYIVDGIEVSANFFNSINPNNIENISFLKDASSAAIYGAKAAYGVVLVTTKTAKSGQLEVTYDGSVGVKTPTYLPEMVNSGKYAELYTLAEKNSGFTTFTFSDEAIKKYYDGSDPDRYPNTDWFDLVLNKSSLFTKHNLQFAGGSDKFKYVLNTGFSRNEELYPGQATNRYDVSAKTIADLKPWLRLTSSVNVIFDKYNRTNGSVSLVEFLRVPPTQVARHLNGDWGSVRNGRTTTGEEANANQLRRALEGGRGNSETRRILGSIGLEIKPIEGLKITNQFGYSGYDYRSMVFTNTMAGIPNFLTPSSGIIPGTAIAPNEMTLSWAYDHKFVYDGWLNYDKTFGDVHDLSVMAGVHADYYMYKDLGVGRREFASNLMESLEGGSLDPSKQQTTTAQYLEESMNSYFARLGYTYAGKYLLEANFRADASSRFAKDGRWGYFPSFSAGWRIDQEKFMEKLDWLSTLKLRLSWGRNGNINNIGLYDTYSTYATSGTILIGGVEVPQAVEGRIGNSKLTWEETTTTNLGLDLSIKNGLFGATIDLYDRLTDGILVRATDIMNETGLSAMPFRNVGKVRNRGFEFNVTHRNQLGDFTYDLGFNMTYNRNKIEDLGEGVQRLSPSTWIMQVGGSIGDFYMLQANGIYSEQDITDKKYVPYGGTTPEAGMIRYVDQITKDTDGDGIADSGDGVINDNDRVVVGNDVPRVTYGMNFNVGYKGLNLSVAAQGVTNVKVYHQNEAAIAFFDNSVPRTWQLDNWTPQNQGAVYPKLFVPSDQRFRYNNHASSFWLFDAAYLRIKNITLSYELPTDLLKKVGLNAARIYMSGDNLFTFTSDKRMKDFDPEAATARGYAIGVKTITAGVTVTF